MEAHDQFLTRKVLKHDGHLHSAVIAAECLMKMKAKTQSKAKTSNILLQLHANHIGISFQFIASQDGNHPLR